MAETTNGPNQVLISSGCIGVKVRNAKVCVDLPLHFGKHCISIPKKYTDGTLAQVCVHICSKWHIPKGVKVVVNIEGNQVASASFGDC